MKCCFEKHKYGFVEATILKIFGVYLPLLALRFLSDD
jgi:hypothetical protein